MRERKGPSREGFAFSKGEYAKEREATSKKGFTFKKGVVKTSSEVYPPPPQEKKLEPLVYPEEEPPSLEDILFNSFPYG